MLVFDTDICIYLLNQKSGHESILKRRDGREHGEIILSAITLAELRYGIAASRRRNLNLAKLELFLASFEVVPFDDRAVLAYGPFVHTSKRKVRPSARSTHRLPPMRFHWARQW
ncbi:MAG: type II toxin-antitoxin system VapC family toxin [Gammaproteobacteria bacterium]